MPSKKPHILRDKSGLFEEETVLIGLRFLTEWKNPVTRGPSADSGEAKQFREFYGEKSELRKFVDNAICEAVVWTTGVDEESLQLIPSLIAKHLLLL